MENKANAEAPKRIQGVDVNRAALKKATTLAEFTAANPHIFDHLGDKEQDAYAELWKEGSFTSAPATTAKAGSTAADPAK